MCVSMDVIYTHMYILVIYISLCVCACVLKGKNGRIEDGDKVGLQWFIRKIIQS